MSRSQRVARRHRWSKRASPRPVTVGHLVPKPPHRAAEQQVVVILEHLDDLADDLTAGAVAVITDERIRVRRRLERLPDPDSLAS